MRARPLVLLQRPGGQDFGLDVNPFCALLEQGLEPPPELGIDPNALCPEFLATSQFYDRETFDFTDPENYRRVDNDVWIFAFTS